MSLSAWCIKHPISALALFLVLSLAGLGSFQSNRVQEYPDVDIPTIGVFLSVPGANAVVMEQRVVQPLERAFASQAGVRHVSSQIQAGHAAVAIEFKSGKVQQDALDDIRLAITKTRSDLPGDLSEPVVAPVSVSASPILALAVQSPLRTPQEVSVWVDTVLIPALHEVPGVGEVHRVGGAQREISVSVDSDRLQSFKLSVADVSRQIKQLGAEADSGRVRTPGTSEPLRSSTSVGSINQLLDASIASPEGQSIRLQTLARISTGVAPQHNIALFNGAPVIGIEISRSKKAGELDLARGVNDRLDRLRAQHPAYELTQAFDFVDGIDQEYRSSMSMLYEGALLAVVVVWLFLRNLRATLICALALPLSVLPTFIGMELLGFTLNTVTLLALSLVIGVLVDDAIVEVENIVQRLHEGHPPLQAARMAADDIALAVIATSVTLVAVFLPTAFMTGLAGQFFRQFGWTASIAVMASLLVARVLTPLLCAYLLKPVPVQPQPPAAEAGPPHPLWMQGYLNTVHWCLNRPWHTLGLFVVALVLSVVAAFNLSSGFIPADDLPQTQVYVELAPGASLQQTEQTAERARQLIASIEGVQSVYTTVGAGALGVDPLAVQLAPDTRKATLSVNLSPRTRRHASKADIEQQMRSALAQLPGARFSVGLGGTGERYTLVLASRDHVQLNKTAEQVTTQLRRLQSGGAIGPFISSAAVTQPEWALRFDTARMAQLQLNPVTVSDAVRIATVGDNDAELIRIRHEGQLLPVVIRSQGAGQASPGDLQHISIPLPAGYTGHPGAASIPLSEVATLERSVSPAIVNRYDQQPSIRFDIELAGHDLGDVADRVEQLPAVKNRPASVSLIDTGDTQTMDELFDSFKRVALLAVVCVYAILLLLFKDPLQPVTLLLALPAAFVGALLALVLSGYGLSMPSMIGLLMLFGISTKNSILLIDYAVVVRTAQGVPARQAILLACERRARPIVMTSCAMIAGMLPVVLGLGDVDPSFRAPMAVVVIGGLLSSTVLCLLCVPAMYVWVDAFRAYCRRLFL